MSRWLIKYYPVNPAQCLKAFNLDILDVKDYCSMYYQNEVKMEYEEYLEGLMRSFGEYLEVIEKTNLIIYYNNKTMMITEADDIIGAISNFNKELYKEH